MTECPEAFLWAAQRRRRSRPNWDAQLAAVEKHPEAILARFTVEERVATRMLLHVVVWSEELRNVVDGLVLPPPYQHIDYVLRDIQKEEMVQATLRLLDESLDVAVVLMPVHLAFSLGHYDARLRAASRRLCWLLDVPFSVVEQREEHLLRLSIPHNSHGGGSSSTTAAAILQHKQERASSWSRWATVGGFAVVGGAALALTGGLAAPLVAPAAAAFATATGATLTAVGTAGGALLAGGVGAAFAGVVGTAATHAAAAGALFGPALSAANVTAVLGAGGAALGGSKALRRTADAEECVLRAMDEVEVYEQPPDGSGVLEQSRTNKNSAVKDNDVDDDDEAQKCGAVALKTWVDLDEVAEETTVAEVVVPHHTRAVTLSHLAAMKAVRGRFRHVVLGIDSQLVGWSLRLVGMKMVAGAWVVLPPPSLSAGLTAAMACSNRFMRPTGAGFVLCYEATPDLSSSLGRKAGMPPPRWRLWLRVVCDVLGQLAYSAYVESPRYPLDPIIAEYRLDDTPVDVQSSMRQEEGVVMEWSRRPHLLLSLRWATSDASAPPPPCTNIFAMAELPQREMELFHDIVSKERSGFAIAIANRSPHNVCIKRLLLRAGEATAGVPPSLPANLVGGTSLCASFAKSSWTLGAVEGSFMLELRNQHEAPRQPSFALRIFFQRSSISGSMLWAVVGAPTVRELQQLEPPEMMELPSTTWEVPTFAPGLFFSVLITDKPAQRTTEFHLLSQVERDVANSAGRHASLTIGVAGYSAIFDPRRPEQDQQVGLWQSAFRQCNSVAADGELLALHWANDALLRFGDTVECDLNVSGRMSNKATATVEKAVKRELMQGAIFSGFHAFNALLGTMQLPLYAVWAADVIDNSYAVIANCAGYAGRDLAAALLDPKRGSRPVSLVGFSAGCKLIAECLLELEAAQVFGVVENVFFLGATLAADLGTWARLRRVVGGRLCNVYTRHDALLWLLFTANEAEVKPMSGITPVNVVGVENIDISPIVEQHTAYAMRLHECLDAIPAIPTRSTWCASTEGGSSPGVVQASTKSDETLAAVLRCLRGSVLRSTACALSIRNNVLVGQHPGRASPTLVPVCVKMHNAVVDFAPPERIPSGRCGVFGVVRRSSYLPMGGVVAFELRLDAHCSTMEVMVIVMFYTNRNEDLEEEDDDDEAKEEYVAVLPKIVSRRSRSDSGVEGDDPKPGGSRALAEVECFIDQNCGSLLDLRQFVSTLPEFPTLRLPVEQSYFLQQRTDTPITVMASGSYAQGFTINIVALLDPAASRLQEERFTPEECERYLRRQHLLSPRSGGVRGSPTEPVSRPRSIDDLQAAIQLGVDRHQNAAAVATPEEQCVQVFFINASDEPVLLLHPTSQAVGATPDIADVMAELRPRTFVSLCRRVVDWVPPTASMAQPVARLAASGEDPNATFTISASSESEESGRRMTLAVTATPTSEGGIASVVANAAVMNDVEIHLIICSGTHAAHTARPSPTLLSTATEEERTAIALRLREEGWYLTPHAME